MYARIEYRKWAQGQMYVSPKSITVESHVCFVEQLRRSLLRFADSSGSYLLVRFQPADTWLAVIPASVS